MISGGGARSRPGQGLLKDGAYEAIKELIQAQVFKPGTFLSERELAARLGMSKTPVRSALERLQAEGFVRISPQQGAVVREQASDEIMEMFDVRVALEPYVLRRLEDSLGRWQLGRLRENLRQQQWAVEAPDVGRYSHLDADFHLLFCQFLGNQEIERVLRGLRDRLHRTVLRVLAANVGRLEASYGEHAGIVEALEEGDLELAVRRLLEHLEQARRLALGP